MHPILALESKFQLLRFDCSILEKIIIHRDRINEIMKYFSSNYRIKILFNTDNNKYCVYKTDIKGIEPDSELFTSTEVSEINKFILGILSGVKLWKN